MKKVTTNVELFSSLDADLKTACWFIVHCCLRDPWLVLMVSSLLPVFPADLLVASHNPNI